MTTTTPQDIQQRNSENSSASWNPFTLADAYEERPPLQYIAGNMFTLPSLNIVYGAPGSFKSMLLADLAACVAGGKDWLPPLQDLPGTGMQVTQTPVVWLDFDNGVRRTLDRFKAIGLTMGLPPDVPLNMYLMPCPTLDANDSTCMSGLAEIIREKNARLVIIDNLAMISGNVDENSADMGNVLHNLRRLSEETGAAVVVIHHTRKTHTSSSRKGESLRGHSSIEGAIDLALLVERDKKSLNISIEATKARDAEVKPFYAFFMHRDAEDGSLISAKFYSSSGSTSVIKLPVMKAILEALKDGELNKSSLTDRVQEHKDVTVGVTAIHKTIEEMEKSQYLLVRKGQNNAQIYSRNPGKSLGPMAA